MAALPVKPPTSTGVLIARPGAPQSRETVTDPVLFASYWKSQDARQTYPQDGPYYVVVWDEQGRGGKYVLSIGGQEEFGLFDLIKYPYTWTKQELWHGNWLAVLVALAVLALIVFGIVWLVRGSRRKA